MTVGERNKKKSLVGKPVTNYFNKYVLFSILVLIISVSAVSISVAAYNKHSTSNINKTKMNDVLI
jgi:hypothetical protein